VLADVQGDVKGPLRFFRGVVLDDTGFKVPFRLVKKADDAAVKTDRINNLVLRSFEDFVELGGGREESADPENALQEFVLVQKRRGRFSRRQQRHSVRDFAIHRTS